MAAVGTQCDKVTRGRERAPKGSKACSGKGTLPGYGLCTLGADGMGRETPKGLRQLVRASRSGSVTGGEACLTPGRETCGWGRAPRNRAAQERPGQAGNRCGLSLRLQPWLKLQAGAQTAKPRTATAWDQ